MNTKANVKLVSDSQKKNKQLVSDHQMRVIADYGWQCCLNCVNFDHEKEHCKLVKATPPIKVAIIGCEQYDGDIPF